MNKRIKNLAVSKSLVLPGLLFLLSPGLALAADAYENWFCGLWAYTADIILPLATIMIMAAGFIWTTSGGDPGKITKAKEIIWGVVSGLGFLLLSYILLKNVIGIDLQLIPGEGCMW